MAYKILILGASYGSLLGTKMAMAGHDVDLVCREATAALINSEGTEVRIKLKGEEDHRSIFSKGLAGKVGAVTPENADPNAYDMIGLAMQEPQYSTPVLKELMGRVAASGKPCLSIMNMPPLPYLKRIPQLKDADLTAAFADPEVWDGFNPDLVTLCSPDPQAFRPPEEKANVLHVGLPTNFKAARFPDARHNAILDTLEADIAGVTIEGKDVPVKLKAFDSLFVPLAKWSMLLTGNYRCITEGAPRAIKDAVHSDPEMSADVYAYVVKLAESLGADAADMVPFEKYANAAQNLLKPSSAARAIAAGATQIERVDRLVQQISKSAGMSHPEVEATVATVDKQLERNRAKG
ncbi:ketopantoate reductase family protein [Roseovarius phycicola]|uniref:Ketopantoate reductase n=1 Tax=Roseovarius phycicola TaxID=3080976 RepID=A0ABZ2HHC7_9RHOB